MKLWKSCKNVCNALLYLKIIIYILFEIVKDCWKDEISVVNTLVLLSYHSSYVGVQTWTIKDHLD